jgi:hypothetical protein
MSAMQECKLLIAPRNNTFPKAIDLIRMIMKVINQRGVVAWGSTVAGV